MTAQSYISEQLHRSIPPDRHLWDEDYITALNDATEAAFIVVYRERSSSLDTMCAAGYILLAIASLALLVAIIPPPEIRAWTTAELTVPTPHGDVAASATVLEKGSAGRRQALVAAIRQLIN